MVHFENENECEWTLDIEERDHYNKHKIVENLNIIEGDFTLDYINEGKYPIFATPVNNLKAKNN